ncbi:YMD8 (YML038C) [Zygosaccharomyces parabailii]|nr:YMD8 (YML038C) [Zygosaccharomyces parabailii]CDH17577.1 related to Putative nucleotide-sugar transporter YMD8 [Zygosaccharomyces bailii ISA1307]
MRQRLPLLVLGWYLMSITLSLYNKWMFDPSKGLQIVCPITVTSFHQLTLWLFSSLYVKYLGFQKNSQLRPFSRKIAQTDWKFYLKYVVPTAVASAGDIGFANVSFKFVTLTIYTIIKSASIAFVLLFGCIFRLEQFHWKLGMIVVVMFFGVVMMVYKPSSKTQEVEDHVRTMFGSLLVLMSSCLSGLRWVFTQLILRRAPSYESTEPESEGSAESRESDDNVPVPEKPHPIYTINQLAPIMGVALLATALVIEKPFSDFWSSKLFCSEGKHSFGSVAKGFLLLTFPGLEVFLMTICEFGILQTAHVLTLSVAGIIKELLTVLCGVLFFRERLSGFHNWAGMSIVLLDVAYYNYFRYTQDQKPDRSEKDLELDQASELYPESCPDTAASYELEHVNNKTV